VSFADDLVARHEPWLNDDLETFLRAIASMFDDVELYALDVVDEDSNVTDEGWTILLDPDRCPALALPYLAQYVGERLPVGLEVSDPALAREWIKDAPNQRRGTMRSMFQAAQRRLLGTRLVAFRERDVEVDRVTFITYSSQTPDPAGTYADIRGQAPADVILNVAVRDGQAWFSVKDDYSTWRAVKDAYATWADVRADETGASTYSRPRP
jgi:hypothetical protein